jgi:hypothetical protein
MAGESAPPRDRVTGWRGTVNSRLLVIRGARSPVSPSSGTNMARWLDDEDDWHADEDDADLTEEAATIACPYCRRHIHEDSPRCPHCGNYLSDEDAPARPKPWWMIIGVLVCLFLVYLWISS